MLAVVVLLPGVLLLVCAAGPVSAPPSNTYDPARPDKMPRPLSNAAFGAHHAVTRPAMTDADCRPFLEPGLCEQHGCYWSTDSRTCYKKHVLGSDGTFAQNYQDWWVRKVAERNGWTGGGYFLDLGAHSGIWCSNTRLLEEQLGWRGVCVEPFPENGPTVGSFRNRSCVLVPRALTGQDSLDGTSIEMELGTDSQSTRVVTSDGDRIRDAYGGQKATLMSIGALLGCPGSAPQACCTDASRYGEHITATTTISRSGGGGGGGGDINCRMFWGETGIPDFINFISLDV